MYVIPDTDDESGTDNVPDTDNPYTDTEYCVSSGNADENTFENVDGYTVSVENGEDQHQYYQQLFYPNGE